MDYGISKNGAKIRLTNERWQHITIGHPEMADYYYEILEAIENPDVAYEGNDIAIIVTKKLSSHQLKFLVVIYKEVSEADGFVITAYLSNKNQEFNKKKILWKQQN